MPLEAAFPLGTRVRVIDEDCHNHPSGQVGAVTGYVNGWLEITATYGPSNPHPDGFVETDTPLSQWLDTDQVEVIA